MPNNDSSFIELAPNITIFPEVLKPHIAKFAGEQALAFADKPEFADIAATTTRHREGITQIMMVVDATDPAYDGEWLPEAMMRAERDLETSQIAHVISDRLTRRIDTLRLHSVILNIAEPDSEFGAHYDGVAGIHKSLSLSPAVIRAHADNHDVIAEHELNPGDQVMFVNPIDPNDRPIHSVQTIEGERRVSLVSRYYAPVGYLAYCAAIEDIGVDAYDEQQFQPRSTKW